MESNHAYFRTPGVALSLRQRSTQEHVAVTSEISAFLDLLDTVVELCFAISFSFQVFAFYPVRPSHFSLPRFQSLINAKGSNFIDFLATSCDNNHSKCFYFTEPYLI